MLVFRSFIPVEVQYATFVLTPHSGRTRELILQAALLYQEIQKQKKDLFIPLLIYLFIGFCKVTLFWPLSCQSNNKNKIKT